MPRPPRALAWLLAALLFMQSAAAAAACLHALAGEAIEICTADGTRLLRLGADGQPLDSDASPGFCPACGALPAAPPPPPPRLAGPAFAATLAEPAPVPAAPPRAAARPPYATRAPPAA